LGGEGKEFEDRLGCRKLWRIPPIWGVSFTNQKATSARNSKLQTTQNTISARWLFGDSNFTAIEKSSLIDQSSSTGH
jgi:hypothetical protein